MTTTGHGKGMARIGCLVMKQQSGNPGRGVKVRGERHDKQWGSRLRVQENGRNCQTRAPERQRVLELKFKSTDAGDARSESDPPASG